MIASRQIAFGKAAGKGLSAKSYIQDGLVAMWDGIENAGWETHDPSATVWKDLVRNKNTNLNSGIVFGDDCAYNDANPSEAYWASTTYTEFCHASVVFKTNSSDIQFIVANLSTRASLGVSNDAFGIGLRQSIPMSNVVGNRWSISANYATPTSSTASDAYVNGVEDTRRSSVNFSTAQAYYCRIGGGFSNRLFSGEICHIRLYSRALTAEEIAHNYSIDKARFGL